MGTYAPGFLVQIFVTIVIVQLLYNNNNNNLFTNDIQYFLLIATCHEIS